jgi:protein CpxP
MTPWLKRTFGGLFGTPAWAGAPGAHGGDGGWHGRWHAQREAHVERFASRAAGKLAKALDLDEAQRERLGTLIDRLQAQRSALRGEADLRLELQALVADDTFDRWRAQDLVNARLLAVRHEGPRVIAALGDFFDGLRPEQQQKVRRFLQRGDHGHWH